MCTTLAYVREYMWLSWKLTSFTCHFTVVLKALIG